MINWVLLLAIGLILYLISVLIRSAINPSY